MNIVEKSIYPPREGYKSPAMSYASDMIHIAVYHDDPIAFMKYLGELGGPKVEVLCDGNIFNYAAGRGAVGCLKALFEAHAEESEYPLKYWLKKAEKPWQGPKARKLV